MQPKLSPSWQLVLKDEIQKSYFQDLIKTVEEEYQNNTCFPPKELIFAAFDHCSFDDIKVVIIGQDPYHGVGEANGLCFSVNDGVKIPPSLRNIYREMNDDLDTIFLPNSGNLEHWAKQGILLINATLSVQMDKPNSHKHLKWNLFTDAVIQKISEEKKEIVFLLWGGFAQKKGVKIDREKHLVLESGHPSPMSANQGKWFGNKHFSASNLYLKEKGKTTIKWISND
ncbi:uracil-DNA glycosylase [Flavobacterium cellulosilyticum]|uniref:Uracil-DNA glycosylase n=1 Tax=Flavobacterium cellulosilyticum TaxID=2541731 RepID=A0A4R5C9I9_9FLAO|nr:uracil-DNA glycosylase [Flavobacterium cellulosilyticum]TDD94860.1 uracil-DNA glycosylase [Flavobacterium cellulosilyticum]